MTRLQINTTEMTTVQPNVLLTIHMEPQICIWIFINALSKKNYNKNKASQTWLAGICKLGFSLFVFNYAEKCSNDR